MKTDDLLMQAEELAAWFENADFCDAAEHDLHRANIIRQLIATVKEREEDSKRLNWLEEQANRGRFELTASLYRSGYEFGFWPTTGPIAEVHAGNLREAIDKAMIAASKEKP